jgi:hypothetical protein
MEFFDDLFDDYSEHGKDVVKRLRTDHPQTYIKVLLLLSPLEATMQAEAYGVVTAEERHAFFRMFLEREEQAAAPPAAPASAS